MKLFVSQNELQKMFTPISVLLLLTTMSVGSVKNINLLLMEQIERDPHQWPAIVAWANQVITTNADLLAGYNLK